MPKRSDIQKELRKIESKKKNENYAEYYFQNADLQQQCSKCNATKPLKEFVRNEQHKTTCKNCHKKKVYGWRSENPVRTQRISHRNYISSAEFIRSFKSGKKCTDCGIIYPYFVLDFHHLQDKEWNVSKLYQKSRSRIKEEMNKCVLICANCHRERTQTSTGTPTNKSELKAPPTEILGSGPAIECRACNKFKHEGNFSVLKNGKLHSYCKVCLREKNRKYSKSRKARSNQSLMKDLKDRKECADCKRTFRYYQMDFDHRGQKTAGVNVLRQKSKDVVISEIEKCDLVCLNCHRIRTHERIKNKLTCMCGHISSSNADSVVHNSVCSHKIKPRDLFKRDQCEISVSRVDPSTANEFLSKHHYAGYGRTATVIYGIHESNNLVAMVKFSPVVRKEVAVSIGLDQNTAIELDRLAIHPDHQYKNFASHILSRVVRKFRKSQYQAIVSFADTEQGHHGGVYRASNWIHISDSSTSYYYIRNDEIMNKKTLYNNAVKSGLTEKQYAESNNWSKVKTGIKHKFVYWL